MVPWAWLLFSLASLWLGLRSPISDVDRGLSEILLSLGRVGGWLNLVCGLWERDREREGGSHCSGWT